MSSNTLPSRAAQSPLHKMYTFVYRTFIKFILFCRGQALDVSVHAVKEELRQFSRPLRGIGAVHFAFR